MTKDSRKSLDFKKHSSLSKPKVKKTNFVVKNISTSSSKQKINFDSVRDTEIKYLDKQADGGKRLNIFKDASNELSPQTLVISKHNSKSKEKVVNNSKKVKINSSELINELKNIVKNEKQGIDKKNLTQIITNNRLSKQSKSSIDDEIKNQNQHKNSDNLSSASTTLSASSIDGIALFLNHLSENLEHTIDLKDLIKKCIGNENQSKTESLYQSIVSMNNKINKKEQKSHRSQTEGLNVVNKLLKIEAQLKNLQMKSFKQEEELLNKDKQLKEQESIILSQRKELEDSSKLIKVHLKQLLDNSTKIENLTNQLKNQQSGQGNHKLIEEKVNNTYDEIEKYNYKQLKRDFNALEQENNDFRQELNKITSDLNQYKEKEYNLMKILYKLNNIGIPVNEFVENKEPVTQEYVLDMIKKKKPNITNLLQESFMSCHSIQSVESIIYYPIYIEASRNQDKPNSVPILNLAGINDEYNYDFVPRTVAKLNTMENDLYETYKTINKKTDKNDREDKEHNTETKENKIKIFSPKRKDFKSGTTKTTTILQELTRPEPLSFADKIKDFKEHKKHLQLKIKNYEESSSSNINQINQVNQNIQNNMNS